MSKEGYYVINHQKTNRSIVKGPMKKADAVKYRKTSGLHFGLNQDHDMLYWDGSNFLHMHHATNDPIKANRYSGDPDGKLEKHLAKWKGDMKEQIMESITARLTENFTSK